MELRPAEAMLVNHGFASELLFVRIHQRLQQQLQPLGSYIASCMTRTDSEVCHTHLMLTCRQLNSSLSGAETWYTWYIVQ